MIPYWLVFAFCIVQGIALDWQLRPDREIRLPTITLWLPMVLVLATFAGLRAPLSSGDYQNYVYWIAGISANRHLASKDPAFEILGELLRSREDGLIPFMFVVAALSLLIKVAILESRDYKGLIGFALIFLVGRFFLLHEFTQVRAALGISLATWALVMALEGRWLRSILVFVLAATTHLSALGLMPLFAVVIGLRPGPRWIKIVVSVIAVGVLSALVIEMNVITDVLDRLAPYLSGQYDVTKNTLMSTYFIVKMVFLAVILFQWRVLNSGIRLALVASLYGTALTIVFLRNDVLSLRLAEIVSIFDCICFAYVFRTWSMRDRILATIGVMILAGIFYYSSTKIVNPYGIAI